MGRKGHPRWNPEAHEVPLPQAPKAIPLTLTPWFDAKDISPEEGRYVWTDLGEASYFGGRWIVVGDDGEGSPSVWCDPSPPDTNDPLGPLTVGHLRRICDLARVGNAEVWANSDHPDTDQFKTDDTRIIDRLRRALERMNLD